MFSVKFLKIRGNLFYQSCLNIIRISFFEAFHALKLISMRCFIPGFDARAHLETFEQWAILLETGFGADFLGIRIQDPADRTGRR